MNKFIIFFSIHFFLTIPLLVFSQYSDLPIKNQKNIEVLNNELQRKLEKYKGYSNKDSVKLFTFFELRPTDSIFKEDFLDGTFLKKLKHDLAHYGYEIFTPDSLQWFWKEYHKLPRAMGDSLYRKYHTFFIPINRDTLLKAHSFIYSKKKKDMAHYDYFKRRFLNTRKALKKEFTHRSVTNRFPYFEELMKYVWDKESLFVFRMMVKKTDTFFIINEQLEFFVFFQEHDGDYNFLKPDGHYVVLPIKEFIDKYWDRFSKEFSIPPVRQRL